MFSDDTGSYEPYCETCDLCGNDSLSLQDQEAIVCMDKTRPVGDQITFLCSGCFQKMKQYNYIEV